MTVPPPLPPTQPCPGCSRQSYTAADGRCLYCHPPQAEGYRNVGGKPKATAWRYDPVQCECGAAFYYVRTMKKDGTTGKTMPLDPSPVDGGNIEVRDGFARVVKPEPGVQRYRSHFATCPLAAQFRKENAQAASVAAQQQADDHAPGEWKREARRVLEVVCRRQPTFTADDLWLAGLSEPPTPAALGPAMKSAQAAGWCEPTGELVPTQLERRHREVRVWRSCLYQPPVLDLAPDVPALDFSPE